MKANYFVTSNTATVFWDKPDAADVSTVYEIYLDGKKIGETAKTHYTLRDLNPDDYLVICGGDGTLNRFINNTANINIEQDLTLRQFIKYTKVYTHT